MTFSRPRLAAEFALLFLAVPVGAAVFVPPDAIFWALFALTGTGLWLLHRTPGFRWTQMWRGRISWIFVAAIAAASTLVSVPLVLTLRPDAWLMPGAQNPGLLLAIWALYPILSALPQEILFRALYFERYAPILPGGTTGLVLNAVIFALAHLIYWSPVTIGLTFAGGLAFAWSYRARGSFLEAVAAHAVAGNILFALGMGAWFYSGVVERPF